MSADFRLRQAGVDSELDAATRDYLAAESEIDPKRGTVVLPRLIRLYRADFEVAGGPLEFALTYLPADMATEIRSRPERRLEWSRFDWTLVGAQSASEDLSAK